MNGLSHLENLIRHKKTQTIKMKQKEIKISWVIPK